MYGISLSSTAIDELQKDVDRDLMKLQDWLDANKFSLNVVKAQSLVVSSTPNIRQIESWPDAQLCFQ